MSNPEHLCCITAAQPPLCASVWISNSSLTIPTLVYTFNVFLSYRRKKPNLGSYHPHGARIHPTKAKKSSNESKCFGLDD
jgi:hypothetical protein